MKKIISILLVVITLTTILTGCNIETKPEIQQHPDYKENYQAIANMMDAIDNGENIIYSPLSLNFAMGMVANGVENEELKNAFDKHFGFSINQYNHFAKYYLSQNDRITKHANSIWVNKDYVLNPSFQKTMNEFFDAECKSVEFNQQFVDDLNKWCNNKTEGLIPSILNQPPEPSYKCFLVNALYFNGKWESAYNKNAVKDTNFINKNGNEIKITGMYSQEEIYLENDNATGFMKKYKDSNYVFVGILPKENGDFKFSDLNIESLLESQTKEKVNTMLPKFKFDNSNILTDNIDSIGLGGIKQIGSLPNIINQKDDLHVGFILQKAIIDVNEEGTEAAAVTIVGTKDNAVMMEEPKYVYLDRPFAFLIYDTENDVVLFSGKVVDFN